MAEIWLLFHFLDNLAFLKDWIFQGCLAREGRKAARVNREIDVSICIVNYNAGRYIRACLDSIIHCTSGINYEVIAVDNASTDGSVQMIRHDYPMVRIIQNDSNRGFARASNQAVRAARGEFILLLNPDTELKNDAINVSVNFLRNQDRRDLLTCMILNPDGTIGVSKKGELFFSLRGQAFLQFRLNRFFPRSTLYKKALLRDEDFREQRELFFVAGCFLLLRRDFFLEIGLFDESFFLYGEDDDLCLRIRHAGGRILYHPEGKVLHWEKKSSFPLSLRPYFFYILNRYRFYRKHYGVARAFIFRMIVFASSTFKILLGLLYHRPNKEATWERKKNLLNWMWALGLKRGPRS